MPTQTAIVDVGIDYLTCTFIEKREKLQATMKAERLLRSEVSAGAFCKPWRFSGYEGFQAGGVCTGIRPDGVIVRLSGEVAQVHWRKFERLASNCSRIDAQVTVLAEPHCDALIRKHYSQLRQTWSKFKRWPEPKLILSPKGAQTLYSGSRSSEVFMRIYDKGIESGEARFRNHLRYEIEFKGNRARARSSHLAASQRSAPPIIGHCQSMLETRGCRLGWNGNAERLYRRHAAPKDVDRCLRWLAAGVRGPIHRLIERGMLEEVSRALELSIVGPSGPTKS